jgi:hypothetical protein
MNGTTRKSSSVYVEPALVTSSATNPIIPAHQRSSSSRPRRSVNHSRQGINIASVLPAAAASVAPTNSQRWRALTSNAKPVKTTTIEAQPSQ